MDNFTLPGYSRYSISNDGCVFNRETGNWLSGSTNPAGYVNFRLTNDDGVTTTFGRHRLVAMVNHGLPPNDQSVVNHLNGIKGDDRRDNLEWVSHQENLEHAGAMGLTEKCIPITTRDPETNQITHYPSATAAARVLGLSKDAVLWRIHNGEERVYPEGLQYRKRNDTEPWGSALVTQYGRSQSVLLRNIQTNSVIRFDKQQDLAHYLNVSMAAVSGWLNTMDQPLVCGNYQVKLESDLTPWREIQDPLKENRRVRPVVVISPDLSQRVFASAKECADAMGLKTTTLNERLKSNGDKVYSDGYRYHYY